MQNERDTPAPALQRGLAVLTALNRAEALSLDELSKGVNCPKASMLRILETLIQAGHVERLRDKTYRALSMLLPRSDESLTPAIGRILGELSAQTGATAEWYRLLDDGAIISQRHEAEGAVSVKAQVGYHRRLDGELEAVASVIAAQAKAPAHPDWWWYDAEGGQQRPTSTVINEHLAKVFDDHFCVDHHYNSNGIRRMAHGILIGDGELAGILALAETFTPRADALRQKNLQALVGAAQKMSKIHEEHRHD